MRSLLAAVVLLGTRIGDTQVVQAQAATPQLPSSRPNVVFIMADDHAAHAISAYGSNRNSTPNIDRLAVEGVRFTNVFATNAICSPSRAAILTGQYAHVNGVTTFNRFDSKRVTFPRLLRDAGYQTGLIGKWHLGSDPVGFDTWEILPGQGAYWSPTFYTATDERTYADRYVTDVITERAIDFLEHRDPGRPFLLLVHHKAPHRPWEPHPTKAAAFAGRHVPEPTTLFDAYATRTDALRENRQRIANDLSNRDLKLPVPAGLTGRDRGQWLSARPDAVTIEGGGQPVTLSGEALTRWKYQRYMQDYLACVQSVDDSVGAVLDYLDSHGLGRDTVVVYKSDQGFFLGEHGLYDKRFMYEESLRMPFLVRWPAAIRPQAVCAELALNVDVAPTFVELAGLPVPGEMQGRSLVPLLKGEAPSDWRSALYYRYYHDPGDHDTRAHLGVRTRTHKLIHFWTKDQWELYDLVNDPHELHNLHGQPGFEGVTAMLQSELARLKHELGDSDRHPAHESPRGVDGPVESLRGP